MEAMSLRARWVLPIAGRAIDGGYVAIGGGRIVAVAAARPPGPVEDLGDVALLPGFVNAHTHLEFSDLATPLGAPGMSLPDWIRLVIAERKRRDHDAPGAIAEGCRESLAAGVTTVGEIAAAGAEAYRGLEGAPALLPFQEVLGFSGPRVDSAYSELVRRYEAAAQPAGLSPHAPYTVHPRLVEKLAALALERGAPLAMHLAESREELQLLDSGDGPFRDLLDDRSMWDESTVAPGSRPLDYLRRLAAAPRSLVIHGNYLAQDEIAFVAARRESMSIVFCPRTHHYFRHEPYPLPQMLAAGVRVALGTDSRASNPDLDMLPELRFAAQRWSAVSPEAWLRMATLDAAAALGLAASAGSLEQGRRADLVAVPCPGADPYEQIVGGASPVAAVWLAGVRVR